MKKLFFITLCMMCFITFTQAQYRTGKYKKEFPTQEMIERLSLKDKQIVELKKIDEEFQKKRTAFREEYSKSQNDPQQIREHMKKMRVEFNKAILKVLDKNQQAEWEKMQAERAERLKKMRSKYSRQ